MNLIRNLFRAMIWVALRFIYRIRVKGVLNLPDTGAAILTPNHVSYIDAVLIASHVKRPIRFAMYWKLYRPFAFILAPLGAFPIASRNENAEIYARAFTIMSDTLNNGGLLCIFPEGKLTLDGQIDVFKNGVLRVIENDPAPIIPIGLVNLWGSYFSKKKSGLFKLPEHFMAKIEMRIGLPMICPTIDQLQSSVKEIISRS